jgi:hypothetical protein
MPIAHRQLVTDCGRLDRNAVMLFAWQRVRRERALHARAGIPCPPLPELLARELREAWGWARAVRRGRLSGMLCEPGTIKAARATTRRAA